MESLEKKTFLAVLKRNNLDFEELDQSSIIRGVDAPKSTVSLYLYSSIAITVIGILSILFFSLIFGIILLFSSIPLFNKASKLKGRENDKKGRTIKIDKDSITIQAGENTIELAIQKIEELTYHIEKDKDISSAVLSIIMEDKKTYELIEIFGDDKRYVEDDMKIISNCVAELLND